MRPTIAVCIATYKRPELLSRLLRSLSCLHLPDGHDIEFRIIDNDANASARAVVETWARAVGSKRSVCYAFEPVANISLARNRAIEMGPADFVLFVDDDESIDPGCLEELLSTLRITKSDIVIGHVGCVHPHGTPAWVRRGGFLDHPTGASGAPLSWKATRCGCTLVLGTWFHEKGFRFDPAYGRSGGEDVDLFYRMMQQGARTTAEPAAIAWEKVPFERTRLRYFWRRAWRTGLCFQRIESRDPGGKLPLTRFAMRLAKFAWTVLTGLPAAAMGQPERLIRGLLILPMAVAGLTACLQPARARANKSYGNAPGPVADRPQVETCA